MPSRIAASLVLFFGLQAAIAAEHRFVVRAQDVSYVTLVGLDDVAIYFTPQKAQEFNRLGTLTPHNITLSIPHKGLIEAKFDVNCIRFTFATIPDKLHFYQAVQAGCCR
jgi:hypothetical protein